MLSSSTSPSPLPSINITVSPSEQEAKPAHLASSASGVSASPLCERGERRLARGFTITVSAPPKERSIVEDDEDDSTSLSERSSVSSGDRRKARRKSVEIDYLAPGEISPEVPLERTESRLPDLEDMLADEEIKKFLETSAHHCEVQQAILFEDEAEKYEALMLLVQKSYEDDTWRNEAAKDNHLLDSLVLFIRQRITEAQNPFQSRGGDFLGRSTRTLKSLTSQSFKRSNTQSSDYSRSGANSGVSSSLSPGTSFFRSSSLNDPELLQRAAIALASAGPAIKLLRNFCVNNKDCQTYLHDHRILDLLLDHIDLFSEVTYQVTEGSISSKPSMSPELLSVSIRRCPPWSSAELVGLPRSLVQLVTNVVSGIPSIQAHVLLHIYPEALVKTIVLSGDGDLLACLLHCLTVQQPTSTIYDLLIADSRSVQIWYLLLSAAFRQAEETLESIVLRRQATTVQSDDRLQGEWISLFISSILKREHDRQAFFVQLASALQKSDVMSFRSIVPKLVLSHSAPSRSPSRSSTSSRSRRSSYEATVEWHDHVHYQVDKVLVSSKPDIIAFFFSLVGALIDGELFEQPIRKDGLGVALLSLAETLQFLKELFTSSVQTLEDMDTSNDNTIVLTSMKSFKPLVQIIASLAALSCLVDDSTIKNQFNQLLGEPLLPHILRFLGTCQHLKTCNDLKWELISPTLPRRDLLLAVANLCYKSPENQKQFGLNQGIPLFLSFAHMDVEDPLMEQAAIFGLRNACQDPDNCQTLKQLLQSESQRVCSDEFNEPQAVVIGKYDSLDRSQICSIEKIG